LTRVVFDLAFAAVAQAPAEPAAQPRQQPTADQAMYFDRYRGGLKAKGLTPIGKTFHASQARLPIRIEFDSQNRHLLIAAAETRWFSRYLQLVRPY